MKRLFFSILILPVLLVISGQANEEDIFTPDNITVRMDATGNEAYGKIQAIYSYLPAQNRLTQLSVRYGNYEVAIPKDILAGHPEINPTSARLSGEMSRKDSTHILHLSFKLSNEPVSRFYFSFENGKFTKTHIHPPLDRQTDYQPANALSKHTEYALAKPDICEAIKLAEEYLKQQKKDTSQHVITSVRYHSNWKMQTHKNQILTNSEGRCWQVTYELKEPTMGGQYFVFIFEDGSIGFRGGR